MNNTGKDTQKTEYMIELSLIWNKGQVLALQIEKFLVPESAYCGQHGLALFPNFTVQWFLIICVIKVIK